MLPGEFPDLKLEYWRPTRDTIHGYAKLLGAVRGALTPRQKHWWHISLRVEPYGITTTEIPFDKTGFELYLDFTGHSLVIRTRNGDSRPIPLENQSAAALGRQTLELLGKLGIRPELNNVIPSDAKQDNNYDPKAAERFWQALFRIDAIFKRFKQHLIPVTSPVQLWPHHFDIAMVWFTGELVPGVDLNDEEAAEKQMNFGFSTGDETIPDPYFYITAYPLPKKLVDTDLVPDARWHTQNWQGAILPYQALIKSGNPAEKLLQFLEKTHLAGQRLMTKRIPDGSKH